MPPPQIPAQIEQAQEKERDLISRDSTPSPITNTGTNNHISHIAHDSMVTVRLSEPPTLTVDTTIPSKQTSSGGNTENIAEETADTPDIQSDGDGISKDASGEEEQSPRITMMDPNGNEVLSPSGSESAGSQNGESRRASDSSEESAEGGGVNWEELEKTEEKEPRSESSDDVSLPSFLYSESYTDLIRFNSLRLCYWPD